MPTGQLLRQAPKWNGNIKAPSFRNSAAYIPILVQVFLPATRLPLEAILKPGGRTVKNLDEIALCRRQYADTGGGGGGVVLEFKHKLG